MFFGEDKELYISWSASNSNGSNIKIIAIKNYNNLDKTPTSTQKDDDILNLGKLEWKWNPANLMHIFWYINLRLIAQTEAMEILHIMRKPYLVIVLIYSICLKVKNRYPYRYTYEYHSSK